MKITSVDIYNDDPLHEDPLFEFSFNDPRSKNPYQVKGIVGLDADELMAQYYGAMSGSIQHKRYNILLRSRTPSIRLGLNPRFSQAEDYSVLRDALYRRIASSRSGTLTLCFMNGDTKIATVRGFVTKLEADQFAKSQEAQITLQCNDPMLRGLTEIDLDVSEFDPTNTVIVDNLSTAPHGFTFEALFTQDTSGFQLQVDESGFRFDVYPTSGGFLIGDVLTVSTEYGKRFVRVTRPGVGSFEMADSVLSSAIWPMVFPGENFFKINPYGPPYAVWQKITYYATYWGV